MTNPPFTTGALTNLPNIPGLDLNSGIGQRSWSFRFALSDGVSGEELGDIHPLRNASLSHDTSRTIKRQLSLTLGKADTAAINPLTDRVRPYMVMSDGTQYPLGRYLFTAASYQLFTSGNLASMVLNDEMFLVDQQINEGVTGGPTLTVIEVIRKVLDELPITYRLETTSFLCNQSWSVGTSRGQILDALALTGDYFPPWFDNDGDMRFIRSFNPANEIPDFNFDAGNSVYMASIVDTSDVLTAPNRFLVISNNSTITDQAVTGEAVVPPTAPNSFAKRGFYITQVNDLQVADFTQALAVAENLAQRQTIFERVTITTAPDPRHDSYNVVRWNDSTWLELSWRMDLGPGGDMTHVLRKGYMG